MTRLTYNVHDTEPARAWIAEALCAQPDMAAFRDLFFPNPGEKGKAAEAKRICAACPVRVACLEDALAEEGGRGHESRHGIRGGMGPRGRRYQYVERRDQKKRAA